MPQRDSTLSITTLYERHAEDVLRYCVRLLGNRVQAEDICQEVFLRAHTHNGTLDSDRIVGWLMRVARNLCLNRIRRVKTRNEKTQLMQTAAHDEEHHTVARITTDTVLTRLGHKIARPAMLYHVDGMTYDEVALELGIARTTAIKRIRTFELEAQRLICA